MLPYRLAAVDLDDTLLGHDKEIGKENAQAVQRLRDAGIQVILASGRRHENMIRFHKQLGLNSGWIVSCNGAQVKNVDTKAVLHESLVPAELAEEIIVEGNRRGATQNFYHPDGPLYVGALNDWTDLYQSRTKSNVTLKEDLLSLSGTQPLKIIWVMEAKSVLSAKAEMLNRYGGRLYITITDPEYLEFLAPGVSKAVGVANVAETFGIAPEEVITFGDGNNDVEMLEWAGLGVTLSHARESAKQAANLIAPDGPHESAFARAVEMVLSR